MDGTTTTERFDADGLGIGLATLAVIARQDVRVTYGEAVQVAVLGFSTWLAALLLARRARRAADAEERAARLEHNQEERARAAAADERARIARELHDVIAHSVSVMTVQAGAARLLLAGDPQRAVEPLLAVEETGRQALAEMRRLLGVLRDDAAAAARRRRARRLPNPPGGAHQHPQARRSGARSGHRAVRTRVRAPRGP